ncbi:MAG: Hpt domain-containing protein [Bryobacteraceae bacterium]|jgi:HPt (histidine-containing phosphotransfer) domain-containing protein
MTNAIDCNDSGRQPPVPWTLSGVLADLERDGEFEFVRDVIDTFLRDTATLVESMRKAAARADLVTLAACGHTLRGSAPLMSADRLAELGREIEQRAGRGEERDCLAMIDRLELVFQEAREALNSLQTALPRDTACGGAAGPRAREGFAS